jgi:membrane-associated PAP2 superfamily phosphatase
MPRRQLIALAAGLLLLAAWEWSGADLALSAWAGGAAGFPLRQHVLLRAVLHDGGRLLALVVLALLVADAAHPLVAGPTRSERRLGLLLVVVAAVAVPALKRYSATSCPWDLAAFGGSVPYVPHWRLGPIDGGPGHCFPSGHAVSAFAFLGVGFAWQRSRPMLARAWWIGVGVCGVLFGAAQLLRGAHYLSHTLWSAWLCWAIAAGGWAAAAAARRSTADHAARDACAATAERRGMVGMVVSAGMDHQRTLRDLGELRQPRGEHRLHGGAVGRDIKRR